ENLGRLGDIVKSSDIPGVPIPTTSLSDRGSSAGEGITISQNCVNTTPGDTPILGTASTRRPKISRTKMQKITTRLAHDLKPGRGARPASHPRRRRTAVAGASGGPRMRSLERALPRLDTQPGLPASTRPVFVPRARVGPRDPAVVDRHEIPPLVVEPDERILAAEGEAHDHVGHTIRTGE